MIGRTCEGDREPSGLNRRKEEEEMVIYTVGTARREIGAGLRELRGATSHPRAEATLAHWLEREFASDFESHLLGIFPPSLSSGSSQPRNEATKFWRWGRRRARWSSIRARDLARDS